MQSPAKPVTHRSQITHRSETATHLLAAVIALAAWAGLAVQAVVSYELTGSLGLMLWTLMGYFTITTNLLVALVFTVVAFRGVNHVPAWIMGGTVLSIVLVGVTYAVLLRGLVELSGGSLVANALLHQATPILVPLFWWFFVPKGGLTWRDPLLWAIYLLAYLVYVGAVVVSVPATLILTMVCGFLFGIVPGALTAVAGATTGAAIVFAIGRGPGADLLRRIGGTRIEPLAAGFRRDAFGYIMVLRLLPLFPFWMTNLAPAACGVKMRVFVGATLLGLLPGALVYAATGAGIEDVVAAHESAKALCLAAGEGACDNALSLRALITPKMVAGLAALAAFALGSMWASRRVRQA